MTKAWGRAIGWTACALALALLALAMLWSDGAAAAGARVTGATVRLAAVAGRPAAGYLTLRGGDAPDTLTGVASPLASRIELHASSMAGGVMRMDALPAVLVPAGGSVVFAPGGNHLMIFGLRGDLKAGATVPLTLHFKTGATLRADALAVAPGAAMDMPMPHGAH